MSPIDVPGAESLLRQAIQARDPAYAPYSGFSVGAALLDTSGSVHTGCNVENVSFGLTVCAERTAIFKAVSQGIRDFRAIAVVGPDDRAACAPCGSCRQVLAEFAPELAVVTPDGAGGIRIWSLTELLPAAFDRTDLRAGRPS